MEFTKEKLKLEDGLKKEWIITNGMGGFASSTIIGANTRKYHGLLIAPLTPPAQRYLILSKVDESIQIEGIKYDLYTNIGENYISQGYKYQEKFEKNNFPIYTYKVNGTEISKTICMEQGKEIVGIQYKIKNTNKKAVLTLAPIVNFRDFHSMSTDHIFDVKQQINGTKVKLVIDGNSKTPVYMNLSEGKYIEHKNDIFKDMFYIEEQKRGFYPKENHSVTGVYEIELQPNEEKEVSFVCGLEENIEEINLKDLIKKENERIDKIIENSKLLENTQLKDYKKEESLKENSIEKSQKELTKELIKAADQFIVYRPTFRLHTIIAGYPWFLDWGRDSLISFEGLLLKTKRYELAKEVLLTMVRDIKYGLVPNGYSGFDNRPLYNSVDASLLLFEQIQKYINYTGDYEFVEKNIYDKLEKIIENYIKGIDIDNNNIYLDSDFLISSGTENTQNTWMDVKTNGIAATPRNGKAVEINSLWYNSLMIMIDLTEKLKINKKQISKDGSNENIVNENNITPELNRCKANEDNLTAETNEYKAKIKRYKDIAKKCKKSFNEKFYNPKRKSLYDVLGDSRIRPNQLFALSLTYPIIEPNSEIAYNMINVVEKKLLNNYGLKSLAKSEPNYVEIYEGDEFKRDMSYHQGITWTWLLGLYFDALRNMIKAEKRKTYKTKLQSKLDEFITKTIKTFEKEINQRGCIGSIAEIYDSSKPYEPKGTIAQAWSVSEILRIVSKQ